MPTPQSYLPLRPVELHLLLVLTDGEQHGYGLARAIAERTDDVVRLEVGNMYRVIRRLLDDELVAEAAVRGSEEPGEARRRYYRITKLGERVVAAELARLRAVLASPEARALARRLAT
jgi:DNA-binding PadR family transcriptional regulator